MLNIKQIGQTWSEADETHRGPNTSQNYPLAAWKEQRAAVNHNSGNKKTQRWNTKYGKYKVIKVITKSRWRGSGQLSTDQQGTCLLEQGWPVIGPELVTWPPPSPLIGGELGMTCHHDNSFTYEDTEPSPNIDLLLMSADNLCSTNV